ncbi:MAG: class I SAM-dependent methyltransferase [Candidatus Acidiferrum sp.]
MNRFENWFCASAFWRYATRKQLLPWIVGGSELGDHILELGAGPGAATAELRKLAGRVTSLEYDHAFAAALHARDGGKSAHVVQGDAATLPFPDGTFSSVIAVLVLHHLRSKEMQDRAFAEVRRALRPGGVFLAFEIPDRWLNRVMHVRSTFVPIAPDAIPARLQSVGFASVALNYRRGAFRIRAIC